MATRLNDAQRTNELNDLLDTGWVMVEKRDAIQRSFKFRNFNEAFGWMTRIAMIAEKMDHHPEWSNVYNKIDVVLSTHSVDGLSELDIELAKLMNGLAPL